MNRMTHFLFNTNRPLWRYSLIVLPLVMLPAMAILVLVRYGMTLAGLDLAKFAAPPISTSIGGAIGGIAFAPIVETYMLAVLITILSSFMSNNIYIAIVSGVLWGLLHAAFGLLWFFGPAWAFFIFTCAFIAWRQKSFKHAYFAAFVPHVLMNLIGILFVYFGNRA